MMENSKLACYIFPMLFILNKVRFVDTSTDYIDFQNNHIHLHLISMLIWNFPLLLIIYSQNIKSVISDSLICKGFKYARHETFVRFFLITMADSIEAHVYFWYAAWFPFKKLENNNVSFFVILHKKFSTFLKNTELRGESCVNDYMFSFH